MIEFGQDAPRLGNQYLEDTALNLYLNYLLPSENTHGKELAAFGAKVASAEYLSHSREAERNKPWLEQFDAYGNRIDKIHTSESWKFFKRESARNGLISTPYNSDMSNKPNETERLIQITKLHLFAASSAMFSCPLAMTDGAATVIRNILRG